MKTNEIDLDSMKEALKLSLLAITKLHLEESINSLEEIDRIVRENNWQNEQWFLDWQDKLNEISVR